MAIADKIFRGDLWQRDCATVINALQTDIRADLPDNTVIAAGTYTPTLTNVANLDGSTAYGCQYIRVGSVVTVGGRVDIDPTTTLTVTQLGISLPIASNFAASNECGGAASAVNVAGQCAAIAADPTNNRAEMAWTAVDTTNQAMFFTFTYRII